MRSLVVALTGACISLTSVSALGAQGTTARSDSAAFAAEWKAVKERYPRVALAYLRQQALSHQLATIALTAEQRETGRGEASRYVQWDVCAFYRRLGIQPVPRQCLAVIPPGEQMAACFEPQRTSDGSYEMRDADEAQACLDAARQAGR